MPGLIKILYSDANVIGVSRELDKRQQCPFESPFPFRIVCYTEVVNMASSEYLFLKMNNYNFTRLSNDFYQVGDEICTVINIIAQINSYEQSRYDEIHGENMQKMYDKRILTLYIDNGYLRQDKYEKPKSTFDKVIDRFNETLRVTRSGPTEVQSTQVVKPDPIRPFGKIVDDANLSNELMQSLLKVQNPCVSRNNTPVQNVSRSNTPLSKKSPKKTM
jgi:hypothetical protein